MAKDSEVAGEVTDAFVVSALVAEVVWESLDDLLKNGLKVCSAGAVGSASGSVVVFSGCRVGCEFTLSAIEAGWAEASCELLRDALVPV